MNDARPLLALEATPRRSLTHAGGAPLLDPHEPWPQDAQGRDLLFLLQVHLPILPPPFLPSLPREGLLQFFHGEEALLGPPGVQEDEVLVRHLLRGEPRPCTLPWDVLQASPLRDPLHEVYLQATSTWMEPRGSLLEFPEGLPEEEVEAYDPEEAYLPPPEPEFYLGGYPSFLQEDFRFHHSEGDTLSLLMGSFSGRHILWGDGGSGTFWLPEESLLAGTWEGVILHWDSH